MKFRNLSEQSVLQTGTMIAVLIYSVLSVLLLPLLTEVSGADSVLGKTVGILASAVSLYLLIHLTVSVLIRRWARPVLGTWAYESSSGNFALLYLDVEGASIHYRVDVYERLEDVLGALDGDPAALNACIGHAHQKALSYQDGAITLVYSIARATAAYTPREGVLELEPMPGGDTMRGYWHSNVEGEESRGTLDIFRADVFRARYASPAAASAND